MESYFLQSVWLFGPGWILGICTAAWIPCDSLLQELFLHLSHRHVCSFQQDIQGQLRGERGEKVCTVPVKSLWVAISIPVKIIQSYCSYCTHTVGKNSLNNVIVISRARLATRESTAAKVRKAKGGLPEPQAYEWVCIILAIWRCFCEHVMSHRTVYASVCALTSFPVDLVCVTDDPLWLVVLSLLSIKGPEGQRGLAGARVSLLSVTASLLQFS